jgi:cephalosporin hydroxylase
MVMSCVSEFYKINKKRPVVLEIGCADGQGVMRYAGFCERVVCVDPMVKDRPDVFSQKKCVFEANKEKLDIFKRRTSEFPVQLVIGCSLWDETIAEVKNVLGKDKIDILVIDGCHHPFDAVWGDFRLYYPLVSKGGFVVFDDLYEDCILQAYNKAMNDHSMKEFDRWSIRLPQILQDTAALIKTEE